MKFSDWIKGWYEYRQSQPQQRDGQAYMNWIAMTRPDLHREIMEWRRDVDCFHSDRYIGAFLAFVATNWTKGVDSTYTLG